MYITHILPERKCCESYQGSNRLAIGHKPLPLRHSRNWRLHLMTSQLICLKIDVNGLEHDVKVHNLDNLFCQFVHLLLMKICVNHEGTKIWQDVVTNQGIGNPVEKSCGGFVGLSTLSKAGGGWRMASHSHHSRNNKNQTNFFVYLSMCICEWLCVLSTLVLRHKAAYICKRLGRWRKSYVTGGCPLPLEGWIRVPWGL